jgi:transposase
LAGGGPLRRPHRFAEHERQQLRRDAFLIATAKKKRERGLTKAGNARVRRGLIQLAWCFVRFQKDSALVQWYLAQVEGGKRKVSMITALARKLLIALWRMVTTGEIPEGLVLRTPAI